MNAIKNIKLNVALGAALVAASMTASPVQAEDFNKFARQARASVLAEVTSQPGPDARVEALRGALQGARVVKTEAPVSHQGERALRTIRSEQLAEMRAGAPDQIARSVEGARIVKRLPAPDRRVDEAVADVRAEQLEAMHRQAAPQLAASLANAHVVKNITLASTRNDAGSSN